MSEAAEKPRIVAVIELGSTGIRLLVASLDAGGGYEILDRAGKPSRLGRDVFTGGSVSRETIRESVAILSGFKELIRGYGIEAQEAHVIATSALREATNRDTFVDRIAMQTGFRVHVIEDLEGNHLTWLAVEHALADERRILTRSNAMILEVGGGSTEIMLLRRGKMAASHSLRLGTVRVDEMVRSSGQVTSSLRQFVEDNVRTACDLLDGELPLEGIKTFVVIGSDARIVAARKAVERFEQYSIVSRKDFVGFAEEFGGLTPDETVAKLRIPWSEADGLGPGLMIQSLFLERTGAEQVVVPTVSIREGVLHTLASGPDPEHAEDMRRQIVASAMSLGRKFRFDEEHAEQVARLSLVLFDGLGKEHRLGAHERLLLEIGALLHDIGSYIRPSGHHKHSEYIIANSEIFGLSRSDQVVVANLARYHRKGQPASTHVNYIALPREDRILVLKLGAILRVADALDRGHDRRVAGLEIERREDRLLLKVLDDSGQPESELSLERLSLAEKGDMFGEVYGMEIVIA
ncbi:MAG TPA: HD domain-containing protein [Rectinemataceae bacterium]|nr:HD domain-containing protein [Rectinemataceae bacterium]